MSARRAERKASPLSEIARVVVRLNHVARRIVNANHGISVRHSLDYCRVLLGGDIGFQDAVVGIVRLGQCVRVGCNIGQLPMRF